MSKPYQFCPQCGGHLQRRFTEGRDRLVCEKCGFIFYQNPIPAVAVVIQKDRQVLLVKRKYEPAAGDWSFPAGFIEWREGPEETAVRELKEETGFDIVVRDLYGVYSAHETPNSSILLVVYRGEIVGGKLEAGDDALEANWFDLTNLPKNIAFQIHREILRTLTQKIS